MNTRVVYAQDSQKRTPRRPSHPFQLRTKPWQIQPFMISPVLPGETMKNLLLQARAVTDPLLNRFLGWHAEYYFFYVKMRDLEGRDDFSQMFTDLNKDLSSYNSSARTFTYHYGGTIDWSYLCLQRVVEEYFRNEGETWTTNHIDNVPVAQLTDIRWLDSVEPFANRAADDIDLTDAGSQDGTAVTASEIETAMRTWRQLRMEGLTNQSYEDYLATHGIRPLREELHRPELLRYIREWAYPTNTVEPTTGVPTSAVSWSIADRADKARFFSEPGFIFGVTVKRPKVYFKNQEGSAVGLLTSMFPWLPAVMADDPRTSLTQVAQASGPLQNGSDTDGYVVDARDIFMYGDQFINFANTATDAGLVDLPTASLVKRYASATDAASLFADDDPGTAIQIHEDGIVSLNIHGHQMDYTPSRTANADFVAGM